MAEAVGEMSDIFLSKIASQNAAWLSARQSLIAGNIANANTPGFKTKDVKPFDEVLKGQALTVAKTHSDHLQIASTGSLGVKGSTGDYWETSHSGVNVSLPNEMIKAGEVATQFQLNSTLMKSFHRMLITAFGV